MSEAVARRFHLAGQVQGVGYRPFVYRLAHEMGVRGWVKNAAGTVAIHAEGSTDSLAGFRRGLIERAPSIARPNLVLDEAARFEACVAFVILPSDPGTEPDIHVPPDWFTCDDCLRELRDPADRRHGYPFINCTQCGPRYTLIATLPYDRPNTAMAGFALCPDCMRAYQDPLDRRFHAEPTACPVCGPHLEFVDSQGKIAGDAAALTATVTALKTGRIVAVKGVGGYHLLCNAADNNAVAELRRRKRRPAKPLAVMFPADGRALAEAAQLTSEAAALLKSPARPIVLLTANDRCSLSPLIAPGLAEIGCLLPYSPLHHLLLESFGGPLVVTSGNVGGEPVLTDNAEVQTRLASIADAFLHHNRPIVRPADDSVYRIIAGQSRPLRLGRGIAPIEIDLPGELPEPLLALGGHMKNTICLAWGRRAVISPHLGELDAARSLETMIQVAEDLQRLYRVRATRLLLDRHPGYGYQPWARQTGLPRTEVRHHHAHASALAWEFPAVTDWIMFTWDGVGLGDAGELWGGEAFVGGPGKWRRAASFRPFRLPGGDQAGRQPWRSAAALLWECGQPAIFAPDLLRHAWERGLNSPVSSAAGRLFDAAAALTGVCTQASFEGEGAMKLEALAETVSSAAGRVSSRPVGLKPDLRGLLRTDRQEQNITSALDCAGLLRSDWSPLLPMLTDVSRSQGERAYHFHLSMANVLLDQAVKLREATGTSDVGLTGGVFQNRLLTELAVSLLHSTGFRVHLPERIPVNDAGLGLGQVMEYLFRHE